MSKKNKRDFVVYFQNPTCFLLSNGRRQFRFLNKHKISLRYP